MIRLIREIRKIKREIYFNMVGRPRFFITLNNWGPICPSGNLMYQEKEVCVESCKNDFKRCCFCLSKSKYIGKQKIHWFIRNPFIYYIRWKQVKKNIENLKYYTINVRSRFMKNWLEKNTR